MALSMDEQRILAEIEQHLAKGDAGARGPAGIVRPNRPGERPALAAGAVRRVVCGARGRHGRVADRVRTAAAARGVEIAGAVPGRPRWRGSRR